MKNNEMEQIKNKAEVIADVMGILSGTIKEITKVVDKWDDQPIRNIEVIEEKPKAKAKKEEK